MERAARSRAVDPPLQIHVRSANGVGVAVCDGTLETARERLDRRAVPEVLEPLPRGASNPLLLLLDVRHDVKMPAARAGGMVPAELVRMLTPVGSLP